MPPSFWKRPDSGAGQPQGYNGSVPTDLTPHSYIPQKVTLYLGKIGFQFGSWPGFFFFYIRFDSFGGIFGRQTAYDNNTVGDISLIFVRSGDSALTESIVFNSLGNAFFHYGLNCVWGVAESINNFVWRFGSGT